MSTPRVAGRRYPYSYYRARYYDSDLGRFANADPLRFASGVNFYAYTKNNPVISTDPSGLIHQAWHESPYDGRLHDDVTGLEVLCTSGRDIPQDILWLEHSIFVRSMEIDALGKRADYNHIFRRDREILTLERCKQECQKQNPSPSTVPETVNEENWMDFLKRVLLDKERIVPVISSAQ